MNKKIKIPQDMIAGTIHKTRSFGDLEIVEYIGSLSVKVKFISTGYETTKQAGLIRKGGVKDLLSPHVFGVGFMGVGDYKASSKGKHSAACSTWENMMKRCYNEKHQADYPTYRGCTVHPSWNNFQNFAKWYEKNHIDGYHLDKDLLVVGNKVYSPRACVFIPNWLNSFTTNSGASRGEYPIGVFLDKRYGNFKAQCSNNGKTKSLGYFSTSEEAHLAWRKYKLQLALNKKPEMDAIDLRIYPNIVQIITEAR